MLLVIINLISLIGTTFSDKSLLQWNMEAPYKYNGFIYTDSHIVVINPAIQIKIMNNEEICNFYINHTNIMDGRSVPFRVVVKSASLGLGELELKTNSSLGEWRNTEITCSIIAEACHDPDSWSGPALVSIKVLDPPGPLWTRRSYIAVINNDSPIGTAVIKVTAYLQEWTDAENKICQYLIKSPRKSPFQIDGEGNIRTTAILSGSDIKYWTLVIVAHDCSQPTHRESQVNVFLSVNETCRLGWTGFFTVLKYSPGSGVKYLSENPKFQLCDHTEYDDSQRTPDRTIQDCISNKTLRLTASVELNSRLVTSTWTWIKKQGSCKLDYQSLKLQREVCGISDSEMLELLTQLNRQKTGALMFPIQANIFPVISITTDNKFSFYFWMRRERQSGTTEEFIICQIDEVGNNIFSVSVQQCILRVQLKSYESKYQADENKQSVPTRWVFSLPQLCDGIWHHIVILASRASENPSFVELSVFIDGEMIEYTSDNPEVQLESPMRTILSNMTDVYLGQCPKSEKTEFKGLLAGVIMTRGIVLKSSVSRCLTKCSERLFFSSMNQMNPGMSVSLNSEMQMIIINGHNIREVIRLVKAIGYVNPTWDPTPGERELIIETEMRCGTKLFRVPSIKISVRIEKQKSNLAYKDALTTISLSSTVSTILIPDSTQLNSESGSGVAIFANTTIDLSGIPQSTNAKSNDGTSTVSKCVITIHPRLATNEYLDWPRHLIEAVSASKYSIKVSNNSRTLIFLGLHNQQIYQFIIQHLRYFSSTTDDSLNQATRVFKLRCYSKVGRSLATSNVVSVKVTIWFNDYHKSHDATSSSSSLVDSATHDNRLWNDLINNMNYVPLNAHSNAALISEVDTSPRKSNNVMYNILICAGLLTVISVLIMFIKRSRKRQTKYQCIIPYRIVNMLWVPLRVIKDKIRPSPSVRVELSRDLINSNLDNRRNISMEMQWDDNELTNTSGFNIISNPMYENSVDDIDDIIINKDVPPQCEEEESTTDDDTYGDFTDLYLDRNRNTDNARMK